MSQSGREMHRLAREVARTPGWTAVRRRTGHWVFRGPDGACVYAAGTPSDRNGPTNARRDLAKRGWTDHA